MPITRRASRTKLLWDRQWNEARVYAYMDESNSDEQWPDLSESQVIQHDDNATLSWRGHIFELSSPILSRSDINGIISGDRFRIFPPFPNNRKNAIAHSLDDVSIPDGYRSVHARLAIPGYAVKGFSSEIIHVGNDANVKPCYLLRLDCESSIKLDYLIELFLRNVRQYTHQWWVSSPRNPFDLGTRLSFHLNQHLSPREMLRYKGAGRVTATWCGTGATQGLVGFERALNEEMWETIAGSVTRKLALDPCIQYFHDATTAYMSYDDNNCILAMALLFEVGENRVLRMIDKPTISSNKKLLRNANIAVGDLSGVFRKIIIDRDNIAHGKQPYHLTRDTEVIIDYLDAALHFLNAYLDKVRGYGWEKALALGEGQ